MRLFQLFAGNDRHQQIGSGYVLRAEYAQIAGNLDRKPVLAKDVAGNAGTLLRLMDFRSAPDDDCLAHSSTPMPC